MKHSLKMLTKYVLIALTTIACLYAGPSFADAAADDKGLAGVAANITSGMQNLVKLITAITYVMGFGFAAAAILKFKAHKDNPAQIPVGTPIALLFIAASLIYLPSLFQTVGHTVFGDNAHAGSAKGISSPEENPNS